MTEEEIGQCAWLGDAYREGPVQGVVVNLHGLGCMEDKAAPDTMELELARRGWLVVFPYCGPWTWMNRATRAFVDELIRSVYQCRALPPETPCAIMGGSMGGLAALLYTRFTRLPVAACAALYPVCDLAYHFTERPDLPKTILYAFRGYAESRDELFAEHSPLAQVAQMPAIPYLVLHGGRDRAVNKERHSDRLVAKMRQRGMDVDYVEIPYMDHGGPMPLDAATRVVSFIDKCRGH